ncbi:flagellar hook-basal body complex protein FliE [Halothiobacillus sp. DCM-1]|uniref:flagellar hook-basal body complex protein FliE n=1 Tax=Halothiobacillus sp. DCM-1 TaxID=3112558 RepID=UPI003246E7EE
MSTLSVNPSVDQILAQMRVMRAAATDRMAAAPTPDAAPAVSFGAVLQNALGEVNQLQQTSSALKTRFELGDPKVDLTQVMLAGQKASLGFNATLQVRNRLLQAYQDVLNMPI